MATAQFFLYLRPFASTALLPVANANFHFGSLTSFFTPKQVDFETVLADALDPFAPLVALGEPSEHLGAGRIASTEGDWWKTAQRLVEHAWFCFVVPSHHPGTFREIAFLVEQGLLEKCCFFAPHPDAKPTATHWRQTCEAIASLGIRMPELGEDAQLYSIANDGTPQNVVALGDVNPPRLRDLIDPFLFPNVRFNRL